MLELQSRQPIFTYSACGQFTKKKKQAKKKERKKTGDSRCTYENN